MELFSLYMQLNGNHYLMCRCLDFAIMIGLRTDCISRNFVDLYEKCLNETKIKVIIYVFNGHFMHASS